MAIRTTEYFANVVLSKRPYLSLDMIDEVIRSPAKRERQSDGRVRLWARVPGLENKVLRVVLLEDGATVHNAFLDRSAPPDV